MADKLRGIVSNITAGAENIVEAGKEISSSAQILSSGTAEQAASSEEISSSMEQMRANIQQNTDNSQETEKIALNTAKSVKEGNKAFSQSVEAMKDITRKILIINDISSQTNLLALNAAVEAARAGQHGKGFSVVAAEIRKLAEKSKQAAIEIDEVSINGTKIAEFAGDKLKEIVPEIEKTAQLVQEIAGSSVEQNSGADQVYSAIQQSNDVTQQYASTSEEMATSAEELHAQAEILKELVSFFRIDNSYNVSVKNTEKIQKNVAETTQPVENNGEISGVEISMNKEEDEYEKF